MATTSRFITDKHQATINQVLADEANIRNEIALAKRAGFPQADKLEQDYNAAINQVKQIKSVYFPNG